MNKKIVVMIVTGIMIFSGFMILFTSNTNNLNNNSKNNITSSLEYGSTGFSEYTVGTNYKNYTLPDYNPNQMGTDIAGYSGMQLVPYLGYINGIVGFIYQDINNNLVFYELANNSLKVLTDKWVNLSLSKYNGDIVQTDTFTNFLITQSSNGNISQIAEFGSINNFFYIQLYNTNNNTYYYKNTTLSYSDLVLDTTFTIYNVLIYPMGINNGIFEFDFSFDSSTSSGLVTSGIYYWSIYSGMLLSNVKGVLGISNEGQSGIGAFTNGMTIEQTDGYWSISQYYENNNTVYTKQIAIPNEAGDDTGNNNPFYLRQLSNGTYLILQYSRNVAGSAGFTISYIYYNETTMYLGVGVLGESYTPMDSEIMSNVEVLENKFNLSSGISGTSTSVGNIYGAYIDYFNASILESNLTWLNNENNKSSTSQITINDAITNNSLFYTYNAEGNLMKLSSHLTNNTIFTFNN